jgi:hypothetical protein
MKKLIIQIWKNKGLILEGILNSILKRGTIEKVYNKRMKICNLCPSITKTSEGCAVPGTYPCCTLCGCSLGFKLRAMDAKCPDPNPKWREENGRNI